ncbi:Protein translocase subunit SecE [uncultured archaeon]|nr:Protein translocase subunit SecE [uncultured archaeon]
MDLEIFKKGLRIITIARKPDSDEFAKIAKITGAGIVGMGLIGLLIAFAFSYL